VDAHLLNTLGVQAAQGRLFTGGETGVASPPPVAVISYELWQSAFGAQPIISHGVDVDGRRLQIVGVMARGADLMDNHTEIWLPLGFTGDERRARNNHNLYFVVRLKEGATVASALGARRSRLLRKAMTESVILSAAGGALGVLLAHAGVEALVRAYPASLPRIGEVAVDPWVTLVSFAVAGVCGLLFGLAPMVRTHTDATAETLTSGPRGSIGTTRHHVRRALVMAETALAVIVVIGAGLLLRTV